MQSSRTLSRSAMSDSSVCRASKKSVGGICFGSPTTITCRPRPIAPAASEVGSCEASSKMMRSKLYLSGARYCATEIGLISMQGAMRGIRCGIRLKICRMEQPRPRLFLIFSKKVISSRRVSSALFLRAFFLSARCSARSCPESLRNAAASSLNLAIRSSKISGLNPESS